MNHIKQLIKAYNIAKRVHKGQTDKGGKSYIWHPIRVALHCKSVKPAIVGLLHDTIEDTYITSSILQRLGFDKEVIIAVETLTKHKGEKYDEFIERCKCNYLARIVKIADLEDNMNIKRIKNPTEKDFKRLEKYKRAKLFLTT
jgi:(p)ppGpp synthase/HD superfamily hydrolase